MSTQDDALQDIYNTYGTLLVAGFIVALVGIGVAGYVWSRRSS